MQVHFIAIGGSAMHNLAIALSRKGFTVTGSDDELFINIIFSIIKIETAIIQESNTDSAQFKFITNLNNIKIINKIANTFK